jgi:hypothetical protein
MRDEYVYDWDCRGHARLQAMRLRSMRVDAVVSVKEDPAGPALAHTAQAGVGIKRELHQVCHRLVTIIVANGIIGIGARNCS